MSGGGCPFLQHTAAPRAPPANGSTATAPHDDSDDTSSKPHYASYLHLETLLQLQDGPSSRKPGGRGCMHAEELTFIVVHQTIELWFKLVASDLVDVAATMQQLHAHARQTRDAAATAAQASAAALYARAQRRLARVVLTLQQATGAIDLLASTMHASDFLEFRDYLAPASGFQSVAFRTLEQLLGVCEATRASVHGASVQSALRDDEVAQLRHAAATQPSLNELLLSLLGAVAVPTSFVPTYLNAAAQLYGAQDDDNDDDNNNNNKDGDNKSKHSERASGAQDAARARLRALRAMLTSPATHAQVHAPTPDAQRRVDVAAVAALFVLCYRDADDALAPLASLLDALLSVEDATLHFRARHALMAERMIGSRRGGTVGTISGVAYLRETQQYRIFAVLWLARCMLLPPSCLPPLPALSS